MAAPTESELFDQIKEKFSITTLSSKQITSIKAVREGKDVFVGTRTGSGKSLTYESAPIIFKGKCVLVIAPLTSIMIEQCEKLNALGFKSTYIGKDIEEKISIEEGNFDFVFSSPENVVGKEMWRDAVTSKGFKEKICLIAVDEAHTVLQWGESRGDDEPFREWFSKIGELRCLFTSTPIVALTATASPLSRRKIMKKLCFRNEKEVIIDSSDRTNIKITSIACSTSKPVQEIFSWMIQGLEEEKEEFPRHLVFCSSINDCARVYLAFISHFGRDQTLVDMYHSKTNEGVKQRIREDMGMDSGKIRILICTNAAGMGVNFRGINNIVHFGLPREFDTFVQQMGRAGRDGSFASELILFKMNKNHLKRSEPELVQFAKEKETCRHKILCEAYLSKHVAIDPLHNCCDVCESKCECGIDGCPKPHQVTLVKEQSIESEPFKREVTKADQDLLLQQLRVLQTSQQVDRSSDPIIDMPKMGELSDTLINAVVENCSLIFTPVDVMSHTTCWSYSVASEISSTVNTVFGDTDMYHYVDESEESDH